MKLKHLLLAVPLVLGMGILEGARQPRIEFNVLGVIDLTFSLKAGNNLYDT